MFIERKGDKTKKKIDRTENNKRKDAQFMRCASQEQHEWTYRIAFL